MKSLSRQKLIEKISKIFNTILGLYYIVQKRRIKQNMFLK